MWVSLALSMVFISDANMSVRIKNFPFPSAFAYACVPLGCVKTELQQTQAKVLWSTNQNVCTW